MILFITDHRVLYRSTLLPTCTSPPLLAFFALSAAGMQTISDRSGNYDSSLVVVRGALYWPQTTRCDVRVLLYFSVWRRHQQHQQLQEFSCRNRTVFPRARWRLSSRSSKNVCTDLLLILRICVLVTHWVLYEWMN